MLTTTRHKIGTAVIIGCILLWSIFNIAFAFYRQGVHDGQTQVLRVVCSTVGQTFTDHPTPKCENR